MANIKIQPSKIIRLYKKKYLRHPGQNKTTTKQPSYWEGSFLIATLYAKQQWSNIFNIFKKCESQILYQAKLTSMYKGHRHIAMNITTQRILFHRLS